jgi:hypothetical protein
MMASRYKIEVKEEPQFAHESFEERKARVLASKPGLTMTCVQFTGFAVEHYRTENHFISFRPIHMPLVFKRR